MDKIAALRKMHEHARVEVVSSAMWLTGAQVALLANLNRNDAFETLNAWKRNGLIFSIESDGVEYFPAYVLDETAHFQPATVVADILKIFEGIKSGWALAFWFAALNDHLSGRRPKDLLRKNPAAVLDAARYERDGIQHG